MQQSDRTEVKGEREKSELNQDDWGKCGHENGEHAKRVLVYK
jgi:hypothetical protein